MNINDYYPDGAPKIVQVAFERGYGPAMMELNKWAYFHPAPSFSTVILEAIQAVCLSHCENKYCAIMHSRGLVVEGFTVSEIKDLIAFQRLPERIPDRLKWEPVLSRIYHLSRETQIAPRLYATLSETLTEQEVDDVGGVIAFSMLHKYLLERYAKDIRIQDEPILFNTIEYGFELIRFFESFEGREEAVYTLCCLCKAVKTDRVWMPIEHTLPHLPRHCHFSHGFCPACAEKWTDQETSHGNSTTAS